MITRNLFKFSVMVLIFLSTGSAAAELTLLSSFQTSPKPQLKCQVSVLVDFETAQLSVVRLAGRGQPHDINAFHKKPDFYANYGLRFDLRKVFPGANLQALKTISARFDLAAEDGRRLILSATSHAGERLEARKDISALLAPAQSTCLQKVRADHKK